MNSKRFKSLNGFWSNISPVKEGKKNHNYAEALIQTGSETEEKVLFFFEKPSTSSTAYNNAIVACREKKSSIISALTEDSEGKYLTCRSTEVKSKMVNFQQRDSSDVHDSNLAAVTDNLSSSNDDMITISGRVLELKDPININKFDNILQKKIQTKYRTGILANRTGAVIIMLWDSLCNVINENDNIILRNMRRLIDGNGQTYFSTTFRTEYSNTTNEFDEYDEQSAFQLLGVEITLFKNITCTVDSVLVVIVTICPNCKTKSNSTDNVATCTNITCGATFKTKTSSIRADLIVTDVDEEKEQRLSAYKDLLLNLIGSTEKNIISNYFMHHDNRFCIKYHYRSNIIETITKLE